MAAPLSPSLQEVTCYVNYGVGAIPLTKWRVVSVHPRSTTLIYIVQFVIFNVFRITVEFVCLFFLISSIPISDDVTAREKFIFDLNQNFVRFLHLHNTGKQMRAPFRLSNKRKDVEALFTVSICDRVYNKTNVEHPARLHWYESDIAPRWVHRETNLMFILCSDKIKGKIRFRIRFCSV